jgi:O-antigen ligase
LAKLRDRRAVGVALAAVVLFGGLAAVFGGKVIARFTSVEGGAVSNMTRLHVWQDTLGMWKDAPAFGHGAASFGQVFPLYQKIELQDQVVLHPESSWLLWLSELGLIPVLLGLCALGWLALPCLRACFRKRHSFFLHAAAFAAVAVLLGHAVFDVPAHRWATAAFALAALGLACPLVDGLARGQVPGGARWSRSASPFSGRCRSSTQVPRGRRSRSCSSPRARRRRSARPLPNSSARSAISRSVLRFTRRSESSWQARAAAIR